MISTFLDEASQRAGERYVAFLMSLRGVLGASLSVRPDDSRAFEGIRSGAYEVARVFLESEISHFETDLEDAQKRARAAAQADVLLGSPASMPPLTDYVSELVAWFQQELRAQIERDVNVIVQKRRELVLSATVKARSSRQDLMTAYLERVRGGNERVDFYFSDRSGRRYPSQRFIRQQYRHALLSFALESYMLEVSSFGIDEVVVTHPERNHTFNGEVITLVGKPGMLQLSDIRDDVFHPNSVAFLTTKDAADRRL